MISFIILGYIICSNLKVQQKYCEMNIKIWSMALWLNVPVGYTSSGSIHKLREQDFGYF